MRSIVLSLSACLVTLLASSCGNAGFETWYGATTRWCGAADELRAVIVLSREPVTESPAFSTPAFPYVWITFSDPTFPNPAAGPPLGTGSWDVTSVSAPGVRYVTGPNKSQP